MAEAKGGIKETPEPQKRGPPEHPYREPERRKHKGKTSEANSKISGSKCQADWNLKKKLKRNSVVARMSIK